MNHSKKVTYPENQRSCFIEGGRDNTKGAIYSAKCTKHNKIYVGHTIQALNERFNGHMLLLILKGVP